MSRTNNWIPSRLCAICTEIRVTKPHKICSKCEATWKEELEKPWVAALVEIADADHNYKRREYGSKSG